MQTIAWPGRCSFQGLFHSEATYGLYGVREVCREWAQAQTCQLSGSRSHSQSVRDIKTLNAAPYQLLKDSFLIYDAVAPPDRLIDLDATAARVQNALQVSEPDVMPICRP